MTVEYHYVEGRYQSSSDYGGRLGSPTQWCILPSVVAATLAAKAATTMIPIVFQGGIDPVSMRLVASLNRPGGNVTGVTTLGGEVGPKRLELLHELVPTATVIAFLINPTNSTAATRSNDLRAAAGTLGLESHILHASAERDFDKVFADLAQLRAGALVIGNDPFFIARGEQLGALTARHAVPTMFYTREFVTAGGLMSYGGNLADSFRMAGVYTSRILKGEKPADLPVAGHEGRDDYQPQDGESAWYHRPALAPWARRRGDRITG